MNNPEMFIMLHGNPINLRVFRNISEVDSSTMLALYRHLYLMCQFEVSREARLITRLLVITSMIGHVHC